MSLLVGLRLGVSDSTRLQMKAGHTQYELELASNEAARQKGLGSRLSMPSNSGMLFSYGDSATRCFWMKDMRFSLDIIWFNSQKVVEQIEPKVAPETYPHTFCSTKPSQFVIELNAGQAASNKMYVGQRLSF
ncbi:MAG TPA: DUF192 domain-containing protein [Patescibacteria group bacterium]|nr:DUF192 domain-containing protein [Patescibacteria group bacterium]